MDIRAAVAFRDAVALEMLWLLRCGGSGYVAALEMWRLWRCGDF